MLTVWNSYCLPLNWSCGFSCEQAMKLGLYCVKSSLQKSLPSAPKHYHTQSPCLASTRAGVLAYCFSLLGKTCWNNNYLLNDLHIRGLSVFTKKKKNHTVTSWKELLRLFRRNHAGLLSGLQCCFFNQHSRGNSEYSQEYLQILVIIKLFINILILSSVQSISRVWLCAAPWTAVCQASLSITNSWSLLKLMSIESVINHLILCCPLLLLPSVFPSIRVFSNESILRIRWPKYWSFSFSMSPSNEYSGPISFKMDWYEIANVSFYLQDDNFTWSNIIILHFIVQIISS